MWTPWGPAHSGDKDLVLLSPALPDLLPSLGTGSPTLQTKNETHFTLRCPSKQRLHPVLGYVQNFPGEVGATIFTWHPLNLGVRPPISPPTTSLGPLSATVSTTNPLDSRPEYCPNDSREVVWCYFNRIYLWLQKSHNTFPLVFVIDHLSYYRGCL